jgi:hypothetical protein
VPLCKSCSREIVFVPTRVSEGKKSMPVDARMGRPEPNEYGNVMLLDNGQATVVGGPLIQKAKDEGSTLYMPHWKTCPDADEHRGQERLL